MSKRMFAPLQNNFPAVSIFLRVRASGAISLRTCHRSASLSSLYMASVNRNLYIALCFFYARTPCLSLTVANTRDRKKFRCRSSRFTASSANFLD